MVQEVWKATSRHWDPPFHIHCQDSGVHNLLLGIFPGTIWCLHISQSIHMYIISVRNMSVFTSSGLLKNQTPSRFNFQHLLGSVEHLLARKLPIWHIERHSENCVECEVFVGRKGARGGNGNIFRLR